MRTRNQLELLIHDNAVIGVVAASDLAAVEAVAKDTLDWLVDELDFDVAAEARSWGCRHGDRFKSVDYSITAL